MKFMNHEMNFTRSSFIHETRDLQESCGSRVSESSFILFVFDSRAVQVHEPEPGSHESHAEFLSINTSTN